MNAWNYHRSVPKRYILSLLAFFGFFNAYVLRSNLSIAIVAMVKPSSTNISRIGYTWTPATQGYILSAFFYGYAAIQIPAGMLTIKIGGKMLLGAGIGLCAFLTLFTPLCAEIGPGALFILRLLEGLSSGFIYPSTHVIWSKWAPKGDKSKLATFAFAGAHVGTFMAMMFGGLISAHWTWQWVFYISGAIGLVWTAIWFYVVAESPETHSTITPEEAAHIEANLYQPVSRVRLSFSSNYTIPWKKILTSLPVWAIVAAHFGANWTIYVMFTELPTFLTRCLGYRVETAGELAALPWLPLAILVYTAGLVSDKLTQNHSTTFVRKLIMAISFIVMALALLMVTLLNVEHRALIILGITIAIGSCGLAWASFGVNHLDIGAQYAGVLMGLSNGIASTPGFLIPILTGYIVEHSNSKREWNIIFMLSIFVAILVVMFYTFFAAGELQPWASANNDEYQHVLNTSLSRDVSQANDLNQSATTAAVSAGKIDDLTDRLRAEIAEKDQLDNPVDTE